MSKDREVYDNGVAIVVRDGNADHMAKGKRRVQIDKRREVLVMRSAEVRRIGGGE